VSSPGDLDELGNAVKNNIRMLRMHRGLTVAALAGLLDERGWPLSVRVLARVERGTRHIRMDELAVFAKVFRVDPADMLRPMSLPAASRPRRQRCA